MGSLDKVEAVDWVWRVWVDDLEAVADEFVTCISHFLTL